jgi:2'-5' RNA ligase
MNNSGSSRLFIALPLDEGAEYIRPVMERLKKYHDLLKPVEIQNIHLTLKFLGDVQFEKTPAIADEIRSLNISPASARFTLAGIGAYPDAQRPSVIWAGMKNCDGLTALRYNIENFCEKLDFIREKKKFHPHITLARVRANKKIPIDLIEYIKNTRDENFTDSCFKRICLYSSDLRKDGPIYTSIAEKNI